MRIGRKKNAHITRFDFLGRSVDGRNLSKIKIAADYRYADYRHCFRPLCTGLAGSVYFIHFIRIASNGAGYYFVESGVVVRSCRSKKVGRPAMMMSCVPASFEILAFFLFAPYLLGVSRIEAAVMGAVLGAVSPAVVVPRMVQLIDAKYGTSKVFRS